MSNSTRRRRPAVSRRMLITGLAGLFGALALGAQPMAADPDVITADAARAGVEHGQLTLIDVRSPGEWRQTGIAPGALLVTIHDPGGLRGFVAAVKTALGGATDKEIALICAVGGRSTAAQKALAEAGFSRVRNVKEGMLGGRNGPGWIPRGLPVVPCGGC